MHLFAGTYFCFFLAILKIKDTISEEKLIFASNKTVCNNYIIENQWHQKKKKKRNNGAGSQELKFNVCTVEILKLPLFRIFFLSDQSLYDKAT